MKFHRKLLLNLILQRCILSSLALANNNQAHMISIETITQPTFTSSQADTAHSDNMKSEQASEVLITQSQIISTITSSFTSDHSDGTGQSTASSSSIITASQSTTTSITSNENQTTVVQPQENQLSNNSSPLPVNLKPEVNTQALLNAGGSDTSIVPPAPQQNQNQRSEVAPMPVNSKPEVNNQAPPNAGGSDTSIVPPAPQQNQNERSGVAAPLPVISNPEANALPSQNAGGSHTSIVPPNTGGSEGSVLPPNAGSDPLALQQNQNEGSNDSDPSLLNPSRDSQVPSNSAAENTSGSLTSQENQNEDQILDATDLLNLDGKSEFESPTSITGDVQFQDTTTQQVVPSSSPKDTTQTTPTHYQNESNSESGNSSISAIAGGVAAALVIIIFAVGIVMYRKDKYQRKRSSLTSEVESVTTCSTLDDQSIKSSRSSIPVISTSNPFYSRNSPRNAINF